MKKIIALSIIAMLSFKTIISQTTGQVAGAAAAVAAITFVAIKTDRKAMAKEISQFRSKEYIIHNIIGSSNGKEVQFETESLASDNSGGLISIAFNCSEVNKAGLLLAFFGENTDKNNKLMDAYGFRYIPLKQAQALFNRIDAVQENNKKYMSSDSDVNNVYIEFEDLKFIIYKDSGQQIRVFWEGFQVIWERAPFDRSKRRLDKWFS